MRSLDWSKTPLGPPESWSHILKTFVSTCLNSRFAILIWWGPELVMLYNDRYREILGDKHPAAMGQRGEACWPEIWDTIGPMLRNVMDAGEATAANDLYLPLERHGYPEECYFTFSYSPIRDESNKIVGVFTPVQETTGKVIGERRLRTLGELAARSNQAKDVAQACRLAAETLAANPYDIPFAALYLFEQDRAQARLVAVSGAHAGGSLTPALIGLSDGSPLASAALRGKTAIVSLDRTPALPKGAWPDAPRELIVLPIPAPAHALRGAFLVAGVSPRTKLDADYRTFFELVAGQIANAISEAQSYEEERRRNEALAELDRAKTAFFSNVSHEFRTPLTLMLGPLDDELGRPEGALPAETRSALETVRRNGWRLHKLVNALLDFSRIEAGRVHANRQPTDLAALTVGVASSFRSAMGRAGLAFTIECPPLARPVFVDPAMWEKVILNLISNAFKFTLSGAIAVRLTAQDGHVELAVEDTGVGIPEQALAHIFERFYRVEGAHGRTHEGTGIGLALVQELVKLHGGEVRVVSALGQGSTFMVSVPWGSAPALAGRSRPTLSQGSPGPATGTYVEEALRWLPQGYGGDAVGEMLGNVSPELPYAGPESRRASVLLADDNADMRNYLRRILSTQYEVTAVSDGEEAFAAALAHPPDLVLTDIMMPRLDGFGLLRAFRSHESTRAVPVLLLSARAGEEAKVEGLEAGAADYLVKPFTARELLARVGAQIALSRERRLADQRLSQIFAQAPVAICALRGRDFVFELANPSFEKLLQGRDLIGRRFADVLPDMKQPKVLAAFQRVLDTGEAFVANEFLIPYDQDRDGVVEDHWFNLVYHPLREPGGEVSGIIAVANEVTQQVRARQELVRANEELEEFAYVASHDLQEPLRMVNIYTQMLLKRCSLQHDAEAGEFAGFVRAGVLRMEMLIKDLLAYSRVVHPEQERARPTDLNRSLESALAALKIPLEETRAAITWDHLPTVMAEESQLAQVFQNLLSNALKYRREKGRLRIHVGVERRQGKWLLCVRDNGIGFERRHAERIFGLFKRLHKEAYPGTGLGLAICRRTIERYGGRIWADSEGEGRGATFLFTLPAVTA